MDWTIRINHNGNETFLTMNGELSYTQATRKALKQTALTYETIESITAWKE